MEIKSKLADLLYAGVCRAYAEHIVRDKSADSIYRFLCSIQFMRVHHFWPNFLKPHSLSEKIWSRMLHDRNPQWILFNDKLRVREYVSGKIGNDFLVPLLWVGANPEEIPFDQLPIRYVIKATHGCEFNIIVENNKELNVKEAKRKLAKWVSSNYGRDFMLGVEWGYKHIKPHIIIEKFLDDNGAPPVDYKFHCFAGRVEVVVLHFNRFEGHRTKSFNREFEPHELRSRFGQWDSEYNKPAEFDQMVSIAETLAYGYDFLRVDLYLLGNKIYFGEITPYPGGVSAKFLPISQDYALGEKWNFCLSNHNTLSSIP